MILCPHRRAGSRVIAEGRSRADDAVARLDEHPEDQLDELIRAVADDDLPRVHSNVTPETVAQCAVQRIWIHVIPGEGAKHLADPWRAAVRIFVLVQLEHVAGIDAERSGKLRQWLGRRVCLDRRYVVAEEVPNSTADLCHASVSPLAQADRRGVSIQPLGLRQDDRSRADRLE